MSIEIIGDKSVRQQMYDDVNHTNDNREYGGYIDSEGQAHAVPPGDEFELTPGSEASITVYGSVTYHSHPDTSNKNQTIESDSGLNLPPSSSSSTVGRKMISSTPLKQPPSPSDINVAHPTIPSYVFGMHKEKVYIYTKSGVQGILPLKRFVNFKYPKK